MRQRTRIVFPVGGDLGEGDIAGRLDEVAELAIGDGRPVEPERINPDAMAGRLLRIVPIRSHAEGAAGDPDHVGMSRLPNGRRTGPAFHVVLKKHNDLHLSY
jgi:hypothetical protein